MLVLSVIVGLGQGFMPVSGYNFGAKNYGRVKEAFWFTVKVGLAITAAIARMHGGRTTAQSRDGITEIGLELVHTRA